MSRALLRSVLELRATTRPSSVLLPSSRTLAAAAPATSPAAAARFLHQTTQQVEPTQPQPPPPPPPPSASQPSTTTIPSQTQPPQQPIPASVRTLLPLLAAQPGGHYITVYIQGQSYLVTEGDSVRLPFKMPGVAPGDVLRLNRAVALGSRDFTLKGSPYVDERLFECRAVVTGTESEPMRVKIKKKQRCRKTKHVYSKHKYTILRISELKVCKDVAEVEA
ncbi:ribosomal protein L21-like protein [Podospora australis]|uniref:Large ribosomal subunit protein bL21m n=1 Tax=Podospora australis TaxID=1536484 RepID=A0AAN7AD11_9PEZI|nr:ribosomal protein L21-like protein [Podospora australis]